MRIGKITPRKDGKFLVHLGFSNGVWLRKIMTKDALEQEKQYVADKEREYADFKSNEGRAAA